MSILTPCLSLAAFIAAVVAICFHLDSDRAYQLGWKRGWADRGQRARQWLRNPNSP